MSLVRSHMQRTVEIDSRIKHIYSLIV
jgi:hypothetical protein